MSSLSFRHRKMLEHLFEMEAGYLMNFSNSSFKSFMLDCAGIDVYESPGYADIPSKAKKFRYFIANESDALVGKVLLELLDIRQDEIVRKKAADSKYENKYAEYAIEIRKVADEMCSDTVNPKNNTERLNKTMLSANSILKDLLTICENACNNRTYTYSRTENEINDYIRDMLGAKGYNQVLDQTRHGFSDCGNGAGEVDILLKEDDKEVAIIEGLKLDSINQNYLKTHINKAIVNYNPLGTPTFIIIYSGAVNFLDFWKRIYSYLADFKYPFEVKQTIKESVQQSASVKNANLILRRDGYDFPVYFIAVNIGRD